MSERDHDIFTKRGITPPWKGGEVARAQGFARYEGADWRERLEIIAALDALYGSDEHPDEGKARELRERAVWRTFERVKGTAERNALAAYLDVGYVRGAEVAKLDRYLKRVPAESRRAWRDWLRKALAVDGWLMPRHSTMPDSPVAVFRDRPVAQLRPDSPVVMGTGWERHHHSYDLSPRERADHEAKLCEWAAEPRGAVLDKRIKDGKTEYLIPTGHLHPDTGEVVVSPVGRHAHWKHAKYLYTPGETARRLGTNPLALERGWGGPDDLFVVVLEGTLKMCSVVEAGYPAIDAGSVTLWAGGVERLDVDGEHLYVLRDVLRDVGAEAVACAPPEGSSRGWLHPLSGIEQRVKRGVDDWLGEHTPTERREAMLDLIYRERVGDAELTAEHPALRGLRAPKTVVALLRQLGEMAESDSRIAPYAEKRLMDATGKHKLSLQIARRHAEERGLLKEVAPAKRQRNANGFQTQAALVRVAPEAMPLYRQGTLRDWLARRG